MLASLLYFAFLLVGAYSKGKLTILHHPGSILLKGHDRLDESSLKEVYSAALGFSIDHVSTWPGMYLTSPFDLAEAVVSVSVDGVADLGIAKGHAFPLRTNTNDEETFYALQTRIKNRYPGGNSKIVDINLSDGLAAISNYEFLHGIKHIKKAKASHSFLKATVEEDRAFLLELNLLNAIIAEIEKGVIKPNSEPDYFNIRCMSMHALFDLYGENSTEAKEARQLLIEAIYHLNNVFTKVYDGNVLFAVVSSDANHTRRIRSAAQGEAKVSRATDQPDINLAKTYNPNYPVIFNIILWFGVVMVFALLAISIAIGSMDPGRDSIIYRMTSTRMKKDN